MNIGHPQALWRSPILWGVVVAIVIVSGGFIWLSSSDIWHSLLEIVLGWGPWVGVALIGLMILHNFIPIPAEMIAISAGATCGVVLGVAVIWIGAMFGAALAFWIARHFGRTHLTGERIASHVERLDRFVAAGGWRGLIAVRLIPIVSFNLVNYGAGLSGVGFWTFIWTTAIGILPITVASVLAGAGLQLMEPVWAIAVLAALAIGLTFFKWRRT